MALDTNIYSRMSTHETLDHCWKSHYDSHKFHIRDILFDHYPKIVQLYNQNRLRDCVLDNVQKALICHSIYLGYDMFECPFCHNYTFVFRSCHGNLCQSCGAKRSQLLAASFSSIALDVPHRHMVFTIPKELRIFFLKDRSLLNILFIAVRNTIAQATNKSLFDKLKRKSKKLGRPLSLNKYTFKDEDSANSFGLVATIHTFGRSLQWNPHIHALVPELIYHKNKDKISKCAYFSYEKLRKTFQFEVLRLLQAQLGDRFTFTKTLNYDNHSDGWYVYAKPMASDGNDSDSQNIQACINYCLRYAGRTPMAESRIDDYDHEKQTIDYHYIDHTTEQRVNVHEPSFKFVLKLLMHCPDAHFKTVRYYGFYANAAKLKLNRIHELLGNTTKVSKEKRSVIKQTLHNKLKYRTLLIDTYHKDPLKCPCGHFMEYVDTMDPFGRLVSLDGSYGGKINDRQYRDDCINEVFKMRAHRTCTVLDP